MKIKTPSDNLILLPMEVLPRVKNASAAELKVLLYLYAKKECSSPELAQQLGMRENFNVWIVVYMVTLALSCLVPIAFIEKMAD